MDEKTPPTGAATSGPGTNGAGFIPAQDPMGPGESFALNQARMAADIQRIRHYLDRIGPAIYVLAYFAAMACLFLAIITRKVRGA